MADSAAVEAGSSSPRHPGSPPLDPVATVPPNAATIILHKAGPHTRQVSRTYRALHPPLLALTPRNLPTPAALHAALATFPPSLTSLDLRAAGASQTTGCTVPPATLFAIPAALPNLQQLLLPVMPCTSLPAMLHVLQACPHLHTLRTNGIILERTISPPHPPTPTLPQPPQWATLLTPGIATRLRSLTLPTDALGPLSTAPPNALPHLTCLRLHHHTTSTDAPHLTPLAAAAPSLCSLDLTSGSDDDEAGDEGPHLQLIHSLATFTALTHLHLCIAPSYAVFITAGMLHSIGALTTLRSLSLTAGFRSWDPAAGGWLSRLTRLTSLCFFIEHWGRGDDLAPAAVDLAATAAWQLPALQRLRFGIDDVMYGGFLSPSALACGQPGSFYRHVAAATQLRHLSLHHLPLTPADASLLTALRHLTALQLTSTYTDEGATQPGPLTLQWVAALPQLQHLTWSGPANSNEPAAAQPPWQLLSSLSCLRTLAISNATCPPVARPLAELLAAVGGRLERLRLGGVVETVPEGADSPLVGLVNLRVLDVQGVMGPGAVVEGLLQQVMGCSGGALRRCYVPPWRRQQGWGLEEAALERLRAAYPLVDFLDTSTLDGNGWDEAA